MGRRSDHSREGLVQMAIDSAESIVKNGGMSALNARAVAKDIGYAVGTLYNLFENIDDLILHINSHTLDDMYEHIKGAKTMKNVGKRYIDYANSEPHLWRMLFEHRVEKEAPFPDWYREKINNLFELVESVLSRELDDKKEVKRAARTLWAGIHGICILSINGTLELTSSETAHTLTNSLIDNYLEGLK